MEKIVTKDWLCTKLAEPSKQIVIIGRALVAIYRRQTADEQANISTKYKNGVGFSGPDARLGTLGARKFLATDTLPEWLVKVWLVEKNGYPRICKYAGQLNEIANGLKKQGEEAKKCTLV